MLWLAIAQGVDYSGLIKPQSCHTGAALAFLLTAICLRPSVAAEFQLATKANVMVEVAFRAARPCQDPFNTVTLDVIFHDPKGHELKVPAFWAGSNVWRVRYASPLEGIHTFRSACSRMDDNGLNGVLGKINVEPYSGGNPLYGHGPLRVAPGGRYLEHFDSTPFLWLGDTWWMGLCHRLHWPDEFRTLAADRKEKGFNVIQIVAGLYPDMPPFDERGANEAGFPWQTNYSEIRPEYFDAADQRLAYLVDQGLTPCIVGAWGYFLPWMGVEKMKAHWRYLIARYAAWPVVWCVAGEANLPWYLAKGFPYDDREQVRGWTEVMRYVQATDPFHRLVTVHPTAIRRYTARHATDDPALLDFDMLQTPHGQREGVPVTIKAVRDSYDALPRMPVIDGEASYEMLGDTLPTEWTRRMFWVCLMNGTAGHTYGANGIWQCNREGEPHGKSPHGGTYGKIPWNVAMHLPGSTQVALAKRFFEHYPWQRFEPHPEWAICIAEPPLRLDGCSWIWFPEGDPSQNAPAAKRYFRREFTIPENKHVERANLYVSADDWCEARLNGVVLGTADDWRRGRQFAELAPLLKNGTNVIAIVAENKPANLPANPAGLLTVIELKFSNGESTRVPTDDQWLSRTNELEHWADSNCDKATWQRAKIIGSYGDGPWGRVADAVQDIADDPQAAGIPGQVRVIYVPGHRALEARALGNASDYEATYFDPVSGKTTSLGKVRADSRGTWKCPAPSAHNHDWVLVLQNGK